MKRIAAVSAVLVCLAIGVNVRGIADKSPPTLAISAKVTSRLERPTSPTVTRAATVETKSISHGDDFCRGVAHFRIGIVPNKAKDLATVLQYLHVNTVHSFEMSPLFGVGREPPPTVKHSPLPSGDNGAKIWQLHEQLSAKLTGRQIQWTWLNQMRGITDRGFVYRSNDRYVVGMPKGLASEEFLCKFISSDASKELKGDERVWDIVELQLVSLLMHDRPVVYDKHLVIDNNRTGEAAATRALDQFEAESLENLQSGAERVMAWNDELDCLHVLGAIRAKETCLKCHEVTSGHLLGAFSYRIKEALRP